MRWPYMPIWRSCSKFDTIGVASAKKSHLVGVAVEIDELGLREEALHEGDTGRVNRRLDQNRLLTPCGIRHLQPT